MKDQIVQHMKSLVIALWTDLRGGIAPLIVQIERFHQFHSI